jgi:cytochrome P450
VGAFFADTPAFLKRMADEHPEAVRLRFGPFKMWVVSDAELVRDVLVTRQKAYKRPIPFAAILKEITPEALFVDEGDVWLRQRRALQPAFHRQRIAGFGDIMAEEAQRTADRLLATQGAPTDVQAEMVRTALNIVGRALFSVDMDATDQGSRLGGAFDSIAHWIDYRFQNFFAPPLWVPTRPNRSFTQARDEMRRIVHSVLAERRRLGAERHDFLQMLMEVRYDDGTSMSDDQIIHESASFFFAGHETTANTLSWAWWLLSVHPEQEAALQREVDGVLAGRPPAIGDLARLPYTQHVIDETLRLYPPAWSISRQPIADETLGRFRVPKADQLTLNVYGMQRSARYFSEPDAFRPERFAEEPLQFNKAAYLPFGAGPRLCIGQQFALFEAQTVLATLAQQLQMRPAPGYVAQTSTVFTLKVKDQLKLVVSPRRG